MKNETEIAVLRTALARETEPGVILATLKLDLPMSNGQICFCVTRDHRFFQRVAHLQPKSAHWSYEDPLLVRGILVLPAEVCRYIRHILKQIGIPHVRGIGSDDSGWLYEQPSKYLN